MTDAVLQSDGDIVMQLRGLVSAPGDEGYVAATSIWARQRDVRPRFVVHCRTANDVQAAIRAARERNLPLSVLGGGHDWAGRALCDGVVIDLTRMRAVIMDSDRRAVTAGGGARVRDITAVTDGHDLAVVAGSVDSVGMAGLTLGGGYGPLIGRFGLALDNLLDAQVVLADGQIVFANAERNEELFWALRGGGGNFGVVTALRYRLHELPNIQSGMLSYPLGEAQSVLEICAAVTASAPDELSVQFGIVAGPDGSFNVLVIPTWCGAIEEGESWLASMMDLGTLLSGSIEQKSYGALLRTFDGFITDGLRVFLDCCWLPALDPGSIQTLVSAMKNAVSPACAIFTHHFRAAATNVPVEETAFGLRREHILVEILTMLPGDSSLREELQHLDWIRNTRDALRSALPGGYPNMLGRNETARATESFGPNAARLMRAKRQYDPDNLFSSAISLPADSA
ncbi:FAD-binding oxidoreductase [Bradyrhizobium lablabi]|uniref:FAD-binding oxidoreductase n=1 Tax=Bradyrhizobium lablabi TaxID=722472 RepID=UPI001BA980D1|nr:FAD-binding oxidoreductase [Bradyrhizobium lablabi]MBR1121506.1 FAD-binding oxidoreductase [Bradyrhizobium lablabi]